jgi:hypothetical protein
MFKYDSRKAIPNDPIGKMGTKVSVVDSTKKFLLPFNAKMPMNSNEKTR